ncbi:MAG: BpuSI family type II restriction endonuclease, partial [Victivallaceae bacterium]
YFHPVFRYAIETALRNCGVDDVEIVPQYQTASGPADFVLRRRGNARVIMPFEIKRTKSSVRGQGRRQARDYQHNLGGNCETPFYCVSNLELTELFRADAGRATTISQQIKLNSAQEGILGITPDDDFYSPLITVSEEIIRIVFGLTQPSYVIGIAQFQDNIQAAGNANALEWHKVFLPFCYEYIRGAAGLRTRTQLWRPAISHVNNPERLIALGEQINFSHIFSTPAPERQDCSSFNNAVLREAYESGRSIGDGDDVSAVVEDLLFAPERGIVETDVELAQVLAIVARDCLGRELTCGEYVIDPGAGSGRLLSAALNIFHSILPTQIIAVESERKFAEALSLRLGLHFSETITPDTTPKIYMDSLESCPDELFNGVKLVVMNPPFCSGIRAAAEKMQLVDRIRERTGCESLLNIGQIGLETIFLELVWHLIPDGTVIAMIFPYQTLTRLSEGMTVLRRFIAERMKLTHLVFYPMDGLFESVVKQTAIFVGCKGIEAETIKLVDIQIPVANIDFDCFAANLSASNDCYGIRQEIIGRHELINNSASGWKTILGTGRQASAFIDTYMNGFVAIGSMNVRRGTVGNKGNTKLTVFRNTPVARGIPETWLVPVLNTADNMVRLISGITAPEMSFLPPSTAYDEEHGDFVVLRRIVRAYRTYISTLPRTNGGQPRAVKTPQEIISDIRADQKDFGCNWVLIPRGGRERAQIAVHDSGRVLISTNFVMIRMDDANTRWLLASWLLSVFGQLQLELWGTSQEGMRKLEVTSVKKVKVPDFSLIEAQIASRLIELARTEEPLMLNAIEPRESDGLWANIISEDNSENVLANAARLLANLYDER